MKTLIAGVGSPILGDDGVGIAAARQCKDIYRYHEDVDVVEIGTGGFSLLDIVQGYDRLILLDAMIRGASPGTVDILNETELNGIVHFGAGHEADLATTLALGRKLATRPLPEDVHIIAVEVLDITTFSESLSPEVQAAIPNVLAAVEKLLKVYGYKNV
jgi:hydrogenase maturation protease